MTLATRAALAIPRPEGRSLAIAAMAASELASGLLGFAATVHLARRLGPSPFARLEFASALAAWLLVIVRGGIEQVVWREAARRPSRIAALSDLLFGLKAVLAAFGYVVALVIAWRIGGDGGAAVAVSALILPAAALSIDVAPRALGCFGPVALGQAMRSVGFAIAAGALVADPSHLVRAAWCGVAAEAIGGLFSTIWQVQRFGWPRPRFHRRASIALASRGVVASLTRFGRVSLYGADLLVLGWLGSADLGTYSAARRLVFAAVALGLVVPTVFTPRIAVAFSEGRRRASRVASDALILIWAASVPAAIVLVLSAELGVVRIFGPSYRSGAVWMALIAARLPWLLSATLGQAALVACRRERRALAVVGSMFAAAVVAIPLAAIRFGALGAGGSLLAIEVVGAVGMMTTLRGVGVAVLEFWSISRRTSP